MDIQIQEKYMIPPSTQNSTDCNEDSDANSIITETEEVITYRTRKAPLPWSLRRAAYDQPLPDIVGNSLDDNVSRGSLGDNASKVSLGDNVSRGSFDDNASRGSLGDNVGKGSFDDNVGKVSSDDAGLSSVKSAAGDEQELKKGPCPPSPISNRQESFLKSPSLKGDEISKTNSNKERGHEHKDINTQGSKEHTNNSTGPMNKQDKEDLLNGATFAQVVAQNEQISRSVGENNSKEFSANENAVDYPTQTLQPYKAASDATFSSIITTHSPTIYSQYIDENNTPQPLSYDEEIMLERTEPAAPTMVKEVDEGSELQGGLRDEGGFVADKGRTEAKEDGEDKQFKLLEEGILDYSKKANVVGIKRQRSHSPSGISDDQIDLAADTQDMLTDHQKMHPKHPKVSSAPPEKRLYIATKHTLRTRKGQVLDWRVCRHNGPYKYFEKSLFDENSSSSNEYVGRSTHEIPAKNSSFWKNKEPGAWWREDWRAHRQNRVTDYWNPQLFQMGHLKRVKEKMMRPPHTLKNCGKWQSHRRHPVQHYFEHGRMFDSAQDVFGVHDASKISFEEWKLKHLEWYAHRAQEIETFYEPQLFTEENEQKQRKWAQDGETLSDGEESDDTGMDDAIIAELIQSARRGRISNAQRAALYTKICNSNFNNEAINSYVLLSREQRRARSKEQNALNRERSMCKMVGKDCGFIEGEDEMAMENLLKITKQISPLLEDDCELFALLETIIHHYSLDTLWEECKYGKGGSDDDAKMGSEMGRLLWELKWLLANMDAELADYISRNDDQIKFDAWASPFYQSASLKKESGDQTGTWTDRSNNVGGRAIEQRQMFDLFMVEGHHAIHKQLLATLLLNKKAIMSSPAIDLNSIAMSTPTLVQISTFPLDPLHLTIIDQKYHAHCHNQHAQQTNKTLSKMHQEYLAITKHLSSLVTWIQGLQVQRIEMIKVISELEWKQKISNDNEWMLDRALRDVEREGERERKQMRRKIARLERALSNARASGRRRS